MANPFSITPATQSAGRKLGGAVQFAGALGQLGQLQAQQKATEQATASKTRQLGQRQSALGLGGETPEQQAEARLDLLSEDPKAAQDFFSGYKKLQQPEKDRVAAVNKRISAAAASILNSKDSEIQKVAMVHSQQLAESGFTEESERLARIAQGTPQEIRMTANAVSSQIRDVENIIGQGERQDKLIELKKESEDRFSPNSEILDDGTIIQTTSKGKVIVTNAEGKRVTGKAAKDAIAASHDIGADIQAKRSGSREAAKAAIKTATEAFNKIGPLTQNVTNLRDGVRLIDEGAGTGAIESRFPSYKAASVELGNLQKKLGLDVVGSVSFGALSEGELQLALDVAMPTGLDGPELKDWLNKKADAQEKLIKVYEEAATFMGTPGNTIADYLKMKKFQKGQSGQPGQAGGGPRMKFDAQGNQI